MSLKYQSDCDTMNVTANEYGKKSKIALVSLDESTCGGHQETDCLDEHTCSVCLDKVNGFVLRGGLPDARSFNELRALHLKEILSHPQSLCRELESADRPTHTHKHTPKGPVFMDTFPGEGADSRRSRS
ncbi:hypothetical protein RUM43_011333 [Polyplax serrata]|uniref:Uncharacterized protein n=1 Tax=Polyplax serrata TaxID=468196 RepID=A0AAN8S071_POLSC